MLEEILLAHNCVTGRTFNFFFVFFFLKLLTFFVIFYNFFLLSTESCILEPSNYKQHSIVEISLTNSWYYLNDNCNNNSQFARVTAKGFIWCSCNEIIIWINVYTKIVCQVSSSESNNVAMIENCQQLVPCVL